jgi:hypothetical protein
MELLKGIEIRPLETLLLIADEEIRLRCLIASLTAGCCSDKRMIPIEACPIRT